MINLLPSFSETLVGVHDWPEVLARLTRATANKMMMQHQEEHRQYIFSGWVKDDRFRISLRLKRPNSFMPLVTGTIEPTSTGCLIFIDYKLFPITRMFLTFWSLFTFLAGVIVSFRYKNFLFWTISIGIVLLINWIARANFNLQIKPTREALMKVLS